MEDPVLESPAIGGRASLEAASLRQAVHDAHVLEVELRRSSQPTLRPSLPARQPTSQQRVAEDPEVGLRRRRRHAALASDVRVVDRGTVAQGSRVQKIREGGQVPHQAFGGDLLSQVVGNVGVEQAPGRSGRIDPWQVAAAEHPVEVEVVPDLTGGQATQLIPQRAPAEQVRATVAHLPRARPAQREAQPSILNQPVDLVEEGGHLLDLVDDHLPGRVGAGGFELFAQRLGAACVATKLVGFEQVDPYAVGIALPEQGALACLARPPEEERLGARVGQGQLSLEPLGSKHQLEIIMII